MSKIPFKTRLNYKFDSFISKGTVAMIYGLGILSLIIITVFGVLLLLFGLHPDHDSNFTIFESLWVNLTHVLDPGVLGNHEENWPFRLFMMFTTFLGLVIISTLIGLVSNGILSKMDELRKGRSFVIEKDHVLILGWSSKIFTIISEICIANENQKRGVIVILADMDKVLMEDEIRDKVGSTGNTQVICRTGNPIDVHDLYIANPFDTKSIIILDKDNENSDSQIIKTIVAIVTNPDRRKEPYHITAEMEDKRNFEVAKMVGKDEVELILSDEIISRIMVQTSRQSGLSVVYIELMDFGGDEIYFMEEPQLVGKTFREILFAYEDSAIMGIQYADGSVEVNPPMDTIFREGDQVIGITEDDDTLIPNAPVQISTEENKIVYTEPEKGESEKILILGWNNRARYIIKELDYYVPHGSKVRVVSKFDDAEKAVNKLSNQVENISLEFEVMDTTDRETLESMNLGQYDYIILLCYQNYFPIQEADAQTLITLLHLRNFTEKNGDKYKIVSEMLDIRNRQLADITSADDFIVSDKLISLLMSQVSENKFLMRVFEDLFDADGSEIYIKPAKEYVKVGEPMNFYTILESAARKNEVAIGYRVITEAKDASRGYGVYVNPPKSKSFTLSENDMVIVLSED
ncbi:CASTOR/POLLUX-related putative ion channel [Marinoscillum furvescens]|uniref:Trk K+ transport system NAD-binding subunit n=1 Tax=Marinoscillum furvescens DSM 4134 TaxID=1122208 RepID=A0A3D9KXZ8_MARFU|nr:NAD-binding protein [Marinoscillum furvescens]RED94121.1 Trk K+ transport system NAD-binding subunit [Marinoscillum furvescens DSM 4134]